MNHHSAIRPGFPMTGRPPHLQDSRRRLGKPFRKAWMLLATATLLFPCAHAATLLPEVDWLKFSPGSTSSQFSLLDDLGIARAAGSIAIGAGTSAPFSPAAGELQSDYWASQNYRDSQSGNQTIQTTTVRVAPIAALVAYEIAVSGVDLTGMVFAVGQLFGSSTGATRQMSIEAFTSVGTPVPVTFSSTNSWDDSIRAYNQGLSWNGTTRQLSLDANADGESEFAFFSIPASVDPVTSLRFSVPDGFSVGIGDPIEFAFGLPVPEPSAAVLTSLAILLFIGIGRHRRNQTS